MCTLLTGVLCLAGFGASMYAEEDDSQPVADITQLLEEDTQQAGEAYPVNDTQLTAGLESPEAAVLDDGTQILVDSQSVDDTQVTADALPVDDTQLTAETQSAEEALPTDNTAQSESDSSFGEAAIDLGKFMAVSALESRLSQEREAVYVYKDFGLTENHFTQKAKMAGFNYDAVIDMNEDWQENPYDGSSCIRCEQITMEGDWGGWLFLNGYLPKGESVPLLNDGSMDGQGLDLTGARELRFFARGENGGETVEFFTAGFGYDGVSGRQTVEYPDSAAKQSLGWVTLTTDWQEYVIDLEEADMSDIVCGFGYVLNDKMDGNADNVFYLDEIRFTGDIYSAWQDPVLLRSYDTENIYIKNVAFTYDNALAAMAFLAEGKQEEAKEIVDAFVYAVEQDRALDINSTAGGDTWDTLAAGDAEGAGTQTAGGEDTWDTLEVGDAADTQPAGNPMRIRNAYAAGDISAYPGWESGARLPGWYDRDTGEWYEDRYQVGSNVGNTSYAALALMQYYTVYGGEEYLQTACSLMDWVIEACSDDGDGFTGGFDGWAEGNPPVVYPFTYKSIEHNIDAYAAFSMLYGATEDVRYYNAMESCRRFIESMYNGEQGLFMTGTLDDGVTPNTSVVVLDAQVWCAMALGNAFSPFENALAVVDSMRTSEGGYPFCQENRNGGWWAEGTAYTALMYRLRGDMERYLNAMNALMSIQLDDGLFPAATVDNLSTGMDLFDGSPWEYSRDPHIAPTAWFIMAANGFNPYVLPDVNVLPGTDVVQDLNVVQDPNATQDPSVAPAISILSE